MGLYLKEITIKNFNMASIINRKLFRLTTALSILVCLSLVTVQAQVVLKGKVLDSANQPLPGAVVTLKSTLNVATATDIDGDFSLKTSQKFPITLTVAYLGYKAQDVTVNSDKFIDVTLSEDVHALNDVVVTALGITRDKKSLGYTTQQLSSEDLVKGEETNLLNALSGKVAGVRITNSQGDMGSSRIIIRGETSIGGKNEPLFVVDGVPVDNSQLNSGGATRDFRNAIADLNPQDIESMSVLKGPNAAALYGSRAAHGVVLITTKSGRGVRKGLGITVNSGFSFSKVATLPTFQNVFGQGASGLFSYVDGKGGGINDGVDESWGPEMNGQLIPQFNSNGIAVPFVAHPDNVKDFFNTGTTFTNGISIAGSDEKFDYRLGVNYQDQKGTVPNTQIKKTNFSINSNYQITKNVKVGVTANYIQTDVPNLPGGPSGNRAAGVMLQFLWFGRQVDMQALKDDRNVNWNSSYYSNPYWRAYYNTVEQNRNRLIGDVHAEVHIWEGLDFKFRTGTDYYNDRRKYKIKYGTNGTPFGSYAEDGYTLNENNTDAILTFKRDLTSDFNIDLLAGYNIRNKTYENNFQKAPRLAVPDLYTLTNSRDPLESSNYYSKLRAYGLYGAAQVSYKNYAFLNLTARNDWSSTLPRSNRSYFYPSVNASLLLTEALDIKSSTLNYLKLRGGWSKVGHDTDPYNLITVYDFDPAFLGNPIQTSSKVKNNPNLKPELTHSTEFGFEAYLFNNRVHLDAAFYNTNSFNQILKIETSASSGYDYQLVNAGKINNKGFEIQLGVTPVQLKDFKWDVDLNYSQNKGEVKELDKEGLLKNYTITSSGTTQVLASVGQRYGTLFGSTYSRDTQGNIIVGENGLPKIDPTSKVLGHYTPNWLGGINNTFAYKNLTLSVLIDASFGGKIYSGTNRTGIYTGVLESTLPGRNADHGGLYYYYQGDNTDLPKTLSNSASTPNGERLYQDGIIVDGVTANGDKNTVVVSAEDYYKSLYNISEAFTYDASYVKLREVQLTYVFSKNLIQKIGLQGANISFVARNLAFLYKKAPNIDPEVALNTSNGQGVESLSLPTTRTFGFNLSLQF